MPRRARLMLPNVPLHIVQRGNNRQACFFADDDARFYLGWLRDYAGATGCSIHAYVLMTNHVHLLLSATTPDGAGALMKALGQRYVQYINRTYRRSGTLWEGRFRSCLTQEEGYLLACQRYIDSIRCAPKWSSIPLNTDGRVIAATRRGKRATRFRRIRFTWHPARRLRSARRPIGNCFATNWTRAWSMPSGRLRTATTRWAMPALAKRFRACWDGAQSRAHQGDRLARGTRCRESCFDCARRGQKTWSVPYYSTQSEFWRVVTTSNSAHSCYGTGAAGCQQVEILSPNGPKDVVQDNSGLVRYRGGVQVDANDNPIVR